MRVKRVLVPVPTTGGLYRILSIEKRPGLAHSAVHAQGVFQPLMPMTDDYRFLTSPEGPLGALGPPVEPGRYLLRLSSEIESGHSWHLPILLAHLALALGCELVQEPSRAELVVWATGEVDVRLSIIDRNFYRLREKIACSQATLQEAVAAGAQITGILPAGEDVSPLCSLLQAVGVPTDPVYSVVSVIAARRIFESALGIPEAPDISEQSAAAVETVWPSHQMTLQAYRVAVPAGPGETGFGAMLAGLRDDLREFAAVLGEASIDERFLRYIGRLVDSILRYDLHRLRVVEGVFVEYAETVEREWPGFVAAHYRALKRQIQHIILLSGG
jgi:hypothetical protein